jgi:hypothetical protein
MTIRRGQANMNGPTNSPKPCDISQDSPSLQAPGEPLSEPIKLIKVVDVIAPSTSETSADDEKG